MAPLWPRWLLIVFCLAAPLLAPAAEENLWPFTTVERDAAGRVTHRTGLGPFLFEEKRDDGGDHGFRPFYLQRDWPAENRCTRSFLYPLFTWERNATDVHWSVFSLINFGRRSPEGTEAAVRRGFDVWPFYFSRDTGDPESSYCALFPLGGTLRDRLGSDRIDFALAPLFLRTETGGCTVVNAPWPFIKVVRGAGQSGFHLWPLFGKREKAGAWQERFAAWPLYFENTRAVEGGTDRFQALLPFYSVRTAPHLRDENYLLFFGSTHRTNPDSRQTRYLWPLFVQATGPGADFTRRWAPFYTHSLRRGTDKTWVLWPLYRQEKWSEAGLAQRKTQLLYFVYWNLDQRDPARPGAAPASKTHVWPLLSAWDNGSGRRQFQLLSPFEVFFQHNESVRKLWTPLTALYRFDRAAPESVRTSFLFNAVTYRRNGADWRFDLGPLIGTRRGGFSLLRGLVAREPSAGGPRWRFLWSPSRPAATTTPATTANP